MCSADKLSAICRQVIATEVSKASVQVAQHNLQRNDVKNAKIFRVSSEEFTAAWKGQAQLRRLATVDFQLLKLETILVDPPRAGLDDETVQLLKEFRQIVYVSCNPDTLHDNLLKVADTHTIKRFALFDQFPYTDHIECGVYLEQKAEVGAQEPTDQLQSTEAVPSQLIQLQQLAEVGSSMLIEQPQATAVCASEQPEAAELSAATEHYSSTNGVSSNVGLKISNSIGSEIQASRKRQRKGHEGSIAGSKTSNTAEGKEGIETALI